MPVPSPCISVCVLDEATGFCKGCKRSSREIGMWPYYSDEEKTRVIAELEKRKAADGKD